MNNFERNTSTNYNTENLNFPEEIRQTFLSRGKRIHELFRRHETESIPSENYLLSEHLAPSETPFGTPRSNSEKDRQFATKWFNDTCERWDKCGIDISRELGEQIESMVKDPNHFFGIHRSYAINGMECETDDILNQILNEGLVNLGDASSGSIRRDPDVSKTVSPCTDMLNTIMSLKTPYKGSTGALLVQIPAEYVNKDGSVKPGMEDQVYNHNELGNSYIKPEFCIGFITRPEQGRCEFKTRQELLASYENSRH